MSVYLGSVTWKCLRTTALDSPKLQGGSQHFPVQSSTQPSMVSTGWVPACFHSETIEQYPLVLGEKKENQCDSCEQIWRWWGSQPCEMQNVFFPLNLMNFKAVIANLIHELCDTLSHGKVLRCLSARRLGVQDDHNREQRLHHASYWIHCRLWRQPENCF